MSTSIDQRVVQMKFDNKSFEQNASQTMSTLDNLKEKLKFESSGQGLNDLNQQIRGISFGTLTDGVHSVELKLNSLSLVATKVLTDMVMQAVNAGKRMTEALTIKPVSEGFNEYELKMGSVQTIMASTGEDLQKVMGYLNELNTYSDRTIYSFSDMTQNIGKFTNAGVKLEDAVAAIKGISNEAAVSGANANEASRAMYNFAQALSAGYVKLIDWKSIENANMATVEFKQELINTAVELGTVVKKGEDYQSVTKDNNGHVSDLFNSTKNFNDALSSQWMTTDVLVQTLRKYTDETTDLGKKAYAAAQDVKTFTQLMDTLKEAVGSGWAETWEIVFGDFNEAKELWTGVNEVVGDFIGTMSSSRNDLLRGGLSTGWKQITAAGISDAKAYEQEIINVASTHVEGLNEMIESSGSFEKSLKEGWLTSKDLGDALDNIMKKVSGVSGAELEAIGFTEETKKSFVDFYEKVQNGTISLDEFAEKMAKPSGRENLIASISNAFNGLMSILKPIRTALAEVFPPITTERLYQITESIRKVTEGFGLSRNAAKGLHNIVVAFLTPIRSLFDIFGEGTSVVGSVVQSLGELVDAFLSMFASTKNFEHTMKQIFGEKIFNTGSKLVESASNVFNGLVSSVKELGSSGVSSISSFGETFLSQMNPVSSVGKLLSGVMEKLGIVFEKAAPIVSGIADKLYVVIKQMIDRIAGIDYDRLFSAFTTAFFGGTLVQGIKKFLDNFGGLSDIGKSILPNVDKVFKGLGDSINDFKNNIAAATNSGIITKFAISIAALAAALYVLGSMDAGQLAAAMAAITGLFGELVGSIVLFTNSVDSKKLKSLDKSSKGLIAFSAAIFILASAVKKLADLEWDGLAKGLIGVGALCFTLTKSIDSLANNGVDKKLSKAALGFIAFSASINILASAVEKMSVLPWESLIKGLGGVGALCLELSLFFNNTSSSIGVGKGLGIIEFAAALKILASVVNQFGSMDLEIIKQGLAGIGTVMAELAVFLNTTQNAKGTIATSTGLVILGASMLIFASAVEKFGTIPFESLVSGLYAMGGVLLELAVALNLLPSDTLVIGAGLFIVAEAMSALSGSLSSMGGMTWEQIVKGLAAMGGALLEFAVALNFMRGTVGGSAALMMAAAAMAIFVPAFAQLSQIKATDLLKGFLALGGVLAAVVAAGYLLMPVVPVIVTVSAAIGGLVLALAALMAVSIADSLSAVFAPFTHLRDELQIEYLKDLVGLIPALLIGIFDSFLSGATTIVDGVGELLLKISEKIMELGPSFIETALSLLDTLLQGLAVKAPSLIQSGFDILMALLSGIRDNIGKIVDVVGDIITNFLTALAEKTDEIARGGMELIISLIDAMGNAFDEYSPRIMSAVVRFGGNIISGLVKGLMAEINEAKNAIINVGKAILNGIKTFFGINSPSKEMESIGEYVVEGLVNGIKAMKDKAVTAVKNLGSNILEGIKNFFGIKSPSVVMKEQVGRFLIQGIAEGITKDMSAEEAAKKKAENITKAFDDAIKKYTDSMSIRSKEFDLWQGLNPDAKDSEVNTKTMERLTKDLEDQSMAVAYAQGDYQAMVQQFGESSEEAKSAYSTYLDRQKELLDLSKQMSELEQTMYGTQQENLQKQHDANAEYRRLLQEEGAALISMGYTAEQVQKWAQQQSGWDPNAVAENAANQARTVKEIFDSYMMETSVEIDQKTAEIVTNSMSNGLRKGGQQAGNQVGEGIKDSSVKIGQDIGTAVGNAANQADYSQGATGVVEGFLNSINDKIKTVGDAGAGLFNVFNDGFNSEAEINSPSKRFYDNGVFIVEGLMEGIESEYPELATYMKDFLEGMEWDFDLGGQTLGEAIINGIKDAIQNGSPDVQNAIQGVVEGINLQTQQAALDKAVAQANKQNRNLGGGGYGDDDWKPNVGANWRNEGGIDREVVDIFGRNKDGIFVEYESMSKFQDPEYTKQWEDAVHKFDSGTDEVKDAVVEAFKEATESNSNNAGKISTTGLVKIDATKAMTTTPSTVNNNYTFNQTNNSPKAISRADTYRDSKNLFSQIKTL